MLGFPNAQKGFQDTKRGFPDAQRSFRDAQEEFPDSQRGFRDARVSECSEGFSGY